jgi:hypothetical protein
MRDYETARGADKATAYQTVLDIMAGLLIIGLIATLLVRPVADKYWMPGKSYSVV